ncbi:hypothetical protein SAXI111661_15710 [Saccharomonospora xinjiangensis]|uniref:hypothetical protein n=1 Tax=Saccharomonospora xinjiangensis TaxID=75294 RepID=UPI00106FC6FB|nr:hypothetical protein [Saccharomonospora xinjiangensis]QBQ61342.1 hypothetical protein EYD13_14970 [Saccharomonospora xinjiangensis]
MLYIVLLLVLTALALVVAALVTASSVWAWVSIGVSGLAGVLLIADRVRRRSRNPARVPGSSATAGGGAIESAGDHNRSDTDVDGADGDGRDGADSGGDAGTGGPEDQPGTEDLAVESTSEATGDADASEVATSSGVTASETVAETSDGSDAPSDSATDAAPSRRRDEKGAAGEEGGRRRDPLRATLVATPGVESGEQPTGREPVAAEGFDPLTDTAPRTALLASSGELAGADVDPPEEDTGVDDALLVSELESEVLVVDEYPRYHLGHCSWLGTRATIPLAVREARDLGFTPCGLCGPDAELTAAHRRRRVARR